MKWIIILIFFTIINLYCAFCIGSFDAISVINIIVALSSFGAAATAIKGIFDGKEKL